MADKWWVCIECNSLNDLPAKKCYKCRTQRPSGARIVNPIADLGTGQPRRVGVTVPRSQVDALMAPPPTARQGGASGVFEDFGGHDDQPIESQRDRSVGSAPPSPLRDPPQRGIGEAGGIHWEEGLVDTPRAWEVAARGGTAPSPQGRPPMASPSGGPGAPGPTGAPGAPWPPGGPWPSDAPSGPMSARRRDASWRPDAPRCWDAAGGRSSKGPDAA